MTSVITREAAYLTKALISKITEQAKIEKRENIIQDEIIDALEDEKLFPIFTSRPQRTVVTASIVLNELGDMAQMDLTYPEWDSLPTRSY